MRWQNPHVQFTLRSRGADGQVQDWRLETNSPGILRRTGLGPELVAVGDRVKVAGNPAVDGSLELNATNMLLAGRPRGVAWLRRPAAFRRPRDR